MPGQNGYFEDNCSRSFWWSWVFSFGPYHGLSLSLSHHLHCHTLAHWTLCVCVCGLSQSHSSPHLARMREKEKVRMCLMRTQCGNNGNARPGGSNLAFGKFILWIFPLHIFATCTDSSLVVLLAPCSSFLLPYSLLQAQFCLPNFPRVTLKRQRWQSKSNSKFIRSELNIRLANGKVRNTHSIAFAFCLT